MNKSFPEDFLQGFAEIDCPAVFATVDKKGIPNVIYVGCFRLSNHKIIIANNKFYKTKENILNGSYGAFLFITKDRKSYQIKGQIENHTTGEEYEDMKKWLDPKYPGYSAVVLSIEEIYHGGEKLL